MTQTTLELRPRLLERTRLERRAKLLAQLGNGWHLAEFGVAHPGVLSVLRTPHDGKDGGPWPRNEPGMLVRKMPIIAAVSACAGATALIAPTCESGNEFRRVVLVGIKDPASPPALRGHPDRAALFAWRQAQA